jgi:hypothetical protein
VELLSCTPDAAMHNTARSLLRDLLQSWLLRANDLLGHRICVEFLLLDYQFRSYAQEVPTLEGGV